MRRALETAWAQRRVDAIVLSSDDPAILAEADGLAGVLALERPAELATDTALAYDVARARARAGGGAAGRLRRARARAVHHAVHRAAGTSTARSSCSRRARRARPSVTVVRVDDLVHPLKLKRLDGDRLVPFLADDALAPSHDAARAVGAQRRASTRAASTSCARACCSCPTPRGHADARGALGRRQHAARPGVRGVPRPARRSEAMRDPHARPPPRLRGRRLPRELRPDQDGAARRSATIPTLELQLVAGASLVLERFGNAVDVMRGRRLRARRGRAPHHRGRDADDDGQVDRPRPARAADGVRDARSRTSSSRSPTASRRSPRRSPRRT